MRFQTARQDLVAHTGTEGVWNPMTEDLDFADFKTVDFRIWTAAATNVQVAPGYQVSKDGVDWETAVATEAVSTPNNDTWNFNYSSEDLTAISTKRMFIRFGVFAKATDSVIRPLQAALEVGSAPVNGSVLETPWALVYADSSTARPFELTAPMPLTERISELRAAIEVESVAEESGTFQTQVAMYEADKPMDPTDWSEVTLTPSFAWVSSTDFGDTSYGRGFSSCAPTKRYIKFGVNVKNNSGSGFVAARVRLRLEYRD